MLSCDIDDRARELYESDIAANGAPLNAPYRLRDGGEIYVVRLVTKNGVISGLDIERPRRIIGTVSIFDGSAPETALRGALERAYSATINLG